MADPDGRSLCARTTIELVPLCVWLLSLTIPEFGRQGILRFKPRIFVEK